MEIKAMNNRSKIVSYRNVVILLVMGIAVFAVNAWTLQKNFYFLFDDIAWLKEVKFDFDVKHFFTILPQSRYNDRPVRTLFFWVLYQLFGLDYTKYYLTTIIWHILNTYLLFGIIYIVLKRVNYGKSFECAGVIALFFGMYPKNLMAVYWIAGAANDLLCAFFSLIAMLLYLLYAKNHKSYPAMLGALAAYILAMRSKEAAICLPVIILVYEIYMTWYEKRKIKIHAGLLLLIGYMLVYCIRIFTLPVGLTGAGQYEQRFSILAIFSVLLNYIRMYFGIDDSTFSYTINTYYTKIGEIGIIIVIAILATSMIRLITKKHIEYSWAVLALFAAIGLSLAPLLILPNIQHLLYFYFPAIFLSMLFGGVLFVGLDKLRSKIKYVWPYAAVLLLLLVLNNIGGAAQLRNVWLGWGAEALSATKDIADIKALDDGYNLYLEGAAEGANVFNYGPGYIVNILYDTEAIHVEHITEETQFQTPYAVWTYSNGHVQELQRVEE